jgi:hypothetical protein
MHQLNKTWTFEHSIECHVSIDFAWAFWTNVDNWALDADVDTLELHGPFAPGTHGTTQSKSSGRIEWRIAEVQPRKAVLEFPGPGVLATFTWLFEDLGHQTRITQRATLSGEQAAIYAESIWPTLQAGIPVGMRKLCEAMEAAASKT